MKALGAVLFAVLFLLTTMQSTVYMCLYQLNKKAITEKYCVNKSKKNSCCKGKCYLEKTIVQAEKEAANNPFSVLPLKLKEVEVLCPPNQQLITKPIAWQMHGTAFFTDGLSAGTRSSLFKPPTV